MIWITYRWGNLAQPWGHGDEAIRQIRCGLARRSYGDARAGSDALPSDDALHEMLHIGVPDDGDVDGRKGRCPDGRGNRHTRLLRHNVSSGNTA